MNEHYEFNHLKIDCEETNKEIILRWSGKSVDRDPGEALGPFLETLVRNNTGNKRVVIDLRDLSLMNSSTLPVIILLLKNIAATGNSAQLLYDPESDWQAVSFKVLEQVSRMLPNIEISGFERQGQLTE